PLTHRSTKQMQQMQLLQPKLEELKKKYKNDSQALNRETMQLYKLYKINPLSGCLPLIIQLPIFWALYSVLRSTIDLRRASFVFWLKDLSMKDPFYILPILMGVSFLAQNLLTSADKRNKVLQIFMPIFLTVIFLNFPSGLQLYWFIYNILSIVESIIARKGGISWLKPQLQTKPVTKSPAQ
ncbi:MAG: YidC/Oxa1 family membrane protein insertase, partial [bacterium]